MIKTLKNTTSEIYNYLKEKVVRFKNWLVILILGAAVVAAPLVLPPNIPDIALEKIQSKYNASDIKDKYRLEKTAFILDAIDENAIQAEVGNKTLDEFVPELTLRKWDDEVNFKVKYKHNEKKKDQKVDIENKKIKWSGKKTEVLYYDIKKGELLHDKVLEHDVFEVEVLLLEKPNTNIVGFDIETKGLKFYYQPELTQKEKDDGAFRPENVIGSYAVYHESKQGDYSKMGLKNYRAGKAFHIYRPKIIDSDGTEVWGELNITDNLLTVEIPQEFLDNAVYPVRHAAGLTFGYDTIGASNSTSTVDRFLGKRGIPSSSGTVDSISFYAKSNANPGYYFKPVLVDSSKEIVTDGVGPATQVVYNSGVASWRVSTYITKPSVVGGNTYYVGEIANHTTVVHYYDTTGSESGQSIYDSSNSYASPTDPTDANNLTTTVHSIYCTYTSSGAARRIFIVD